MEHMEAIEDIRRCSLEAAVMRLHHCTLDNPTGAEHKADVKISALSLYTGKNNRVKLKKPFKIALEI